MSGRNGWRVVFLGATAAVLGMEVWASVDGDARTEPWTALIIRYVPWEVAAALVGAGVLWVPLHFGVRYLRKHRDDASNGIA